MIVAVTERFHDYEPSLGYVDASKLDENDYVDSCFLKAIKAGEEHCYIDASDWEEYPEKFPRDKVGLSVPYMEETPDKIDRAIIFSIDFNC